MLAQHEIGAHEKIPTACMSSNESRPDLSAREPVDRGGFRNFGRDRLRLLNGPLSGKPGSENWFDSSPGNRPDCRPVLSPLGVFFAAPKGPSVKFLVTVNSCRYAQFDAGSAGPVSGGPPQH